MNSNHIVLNSLRYLIFFSLCFVTTTSSATTSPTDLLKVYIQTYSELYQLQHIASDIDEHTIHLQQGFVIVYANKTEQLALKTAGFHFQVLIENLSNYYARRAAINTRQATNHSMGGFRTLAEIEQTLENLSRNFPHIVHMFSIGKSYEGRDIWAIRISDNPSLYESQEPTVWFDALHHAREAMSGESLLLFAEWLVNYYAVDPTVTRLIHSRNILLIPCVNPDGYDYNHQQNPEGGGLWRKNRRKHEDGSYGVDLNRNYGWEWRYDQEDSSQNNYQGTQPFSEPETAAIRDFLTQQTPTMSISVHSYNNEWMYPWGYTALPTVDNDIFHTYAAKIVKTNGYTADTAWNLYGITRGASDDYHYGMHHSLAFTVEIGSFEDGFWPSPTRIPTLFDDVQPGYQMITQWAGAWPNITPLWSEQQGNGDDGFDAGETWQLSLLIKNEGVLTLDTDIAIISNTYDISIENNNSHISLAPHLEAATSTFQLQFADALDPEIPQILDVQLDYEGFISHTPLKLTLGATHDSTNTAATIMVLGKVTSGNFVHFVIDGPAQTSVEIFWSLEASTAQYFPNIDGSVYLAGSIHSLFEGKTDKNGQLNRLLQLPQSNDLSGKTIYLQALFDKENKPFVSRLTQVKFE